MKHMFINIRAGWIIGMAWLATTLAVAQRTPGDTWSILARVKFTEKFYKELNEYYLVPLLDTRIRAYEGKPFTLKGHYLALDLEDRRAIVLSKNPYAACFFCGGAGPESVAEVIFDGKRPRLKADQVITVTGVLKLNDKDLNHLNFIIEQAHIETAP